MVEVMRQYAKLQKQSGSPKLSLEDQVLVAMPLLALNIAPNFILRAYWYVYESTICRTVHKLVSTLIRSGKFRCAGKKSLLQGKVPEALVVDVTESPRERPKSQQKQFSSGKKKRPTFKS